MIVAGFDVICAFINSYISGHIIFFFVTKKTSKIETHWIDCTPMYQDTLKTKKQVPMKASFGLRCDILNFELLRLTGLRS